MKITYTELIGDHQQIEASAAALLSDIEDGSVSANDLSSHVRELAVLVNHHIDIEDQIIRDVDSKVLNDQWRKVWVDADAAFAKLRRDWVAFIDSWSAIEIERNRDKFSAAASEMFNRLTGRLTLETKAFYATALQTGAIALR